MKMSRFTRVAAAAAAAASLAAMPAASASAQTIHVSQPPCDSVPGCVNYALLTAEQLAAEVQRIYNEEVQPEVEDAVCAAYYVVTGIRCP